MQPIDCFLKIFTHLYFVNKHKIILTWHIMCIYIIIQCTIGQQIIIIREIIINLNDVTIWYLFLDICFECFQQLRFSTSPDTGNYFNIRRPKYINQLIQILSSLYEFHLNQSPRTYYVLIILFLLAKINIFSFFANRFLLLTFLYHSHPENDVLRRPFYRRQPFPDSHFPRS